jgi:hypothetical protein
MNKLSMVFKNPLIYSRSYFIDLRDNLQSKKAYWTEEVQIFFKINGVTDEKVDARKWDPIEIPGEEYPLHPFTVVEAISHSVGHFTLDDFSKEKKGMAGFPFIIGRLLKGNIMARKGRKGRK